MANRILDIQRRLEHKYGNTAQPTASTGFSWRSRAFSDQSFDLRFQVPLVPQQTDMSCWAAGAAMVVAWRENYSADPARIARAAGEWASYSAGLHPESTSIFPVWGLTPEPQQSYSVAGFRQLLETYGPLWVAGAVPGSHIRVVTGLYGDGTPEGTRVIINDPWEKGMTTFVLPNAGAQYEETYSQFVTETEKLARQEAANFPKAIYVARSSRRREATAQSRSFSGFMRSRNSRRSYPLVPNFPTRSFSIPVDFRVPRAVPIIGKPSLATAWAAATAMLLSYKDGKLVSVEEAVRRAGAAYEQRLRSDAALRKTEIADYLGALGLVASSFAEPDAEKIDQMLRRFGALWITLDYDPAFSLDARIITSIQGDGTATGTNLTLIDLGNGTEGALALNRLAGIFDRQELSTPDSQLMAIHWPPDTLSSVSPNGVPASAPLPTNGNVSVQNSFPVHYLYKTHTQNYHPFQQSVYSSAQTVPLIIAGMEVADAAQIGLAAVAMVQQQVSNSQGSFTLTYDRVERLLTTEARDAMIPLPAMQYTYPLLYIGASKPIIEMAVADIQIRWEGNAYGEIGTITIERNLGTSTEWSKSTANIKIERSNHIPKARTDPRAWPIVYTYSGTYDPAGNGYFEFSGEFEVNAFGRLHFNRHDVFPRSFANWAIGGSPYDYVRRGADVDVPVPDIPKDQINFLRTKLPSP